jgi:hypothetical protein
MNEIPLTTIDRKKIAIRFLYTVFFLIVFEILKTIIQVTVLFQYIYLFIFKKYGNPVRDFSNKVTAYTYKVIRYLSLNDNKIPFPFSDFPNVLEPPEEYVEFK